jgi:hypothetical protein
MFGLSEPKMVDPYTVKSSLTQAEKDKKPVIF